MQDTKENGSREKSRITLADKISTIAIFFSPLPPHHVLPFHWQFPDRTFKFCFAWSARVHAILVASQCIGIHFKGVQLRWDHISPWSPAENARSSSAMEAEKLRRMEVGKENSRVKWRRVRNSRAVALYDDSSFTRKSQCSATVLAACRNVHLLTSSVWLSPSFIRGYT